MHSAPDSDIYNFLPWLTDSSTCNHDTFRIKPYISEHYHLLNTVDTVFINFGTLHISNCGIPDFDLLSCINLPLELDCPAFGVSVYSSESDNLNFYMQYTCDSGCANCPNILTEASAATYHHCPGSCTSIPFTDSVWSFLRTNLGSLNEDSTIHQFYNTCGSKYYNPGLRMI